MFNVCDILFLYDFFPAQLKVFPQVYLWKMMIEIIDLKYLSILNRNSRIYQIAVINLSFDVLFKILQVMLNYTKNL